jgi:hypothetical protein
MEGRRFHVKQQDQEAKETGFKLQWQVKCWKGMKNEECRTLYRQMMEEMNNVSKAVVFTDREMWQYHHAFTHSSSSSPSSSSFSYNLSLLCILGVGLCLQIRHALCFLTLFSVGYLVSVSCRWRVGLELKSITWLMVWSLCMSFP